MATLHYRPDLNPENELIPGVEQGDLTDAEQAALPAFVLAAVTASGFYNATPTAPDWEPPDPAPLSAPITLLYFRGDIYPNDGSSIPGVPLDNILDETYDSYPEHVQNDINAIGYYITDLFDLQDVLTDYWPLGTNLTDTFGGRNFTRAGTGSTTFVDRGHGNAVQLASATGQYLTATNNVKLQVASDFTLAGWLRTEAADGVIINKGGSLPKDKEYAIQLDGGTLGFVVGDGTNSATATSEAFPSDGEKHMFVAVFDNTANLLSLYVDDADAETTAYTHNTQQLTGALTVGDGTFDLDIWGLAKADRAWDADDVAAYFAAGGAVIPDLS